MKSSWPILLLVLAAVPGVNAQTPEVLAGGVVNGASFANGQPVTPGSLISIFGNNLAATTTLADSIPLSTVLGNVSVTFNNVSAPMLAVFPSNGPGLSQINAQVPVDALPPGVTSGTVTMVVTRDGVSSEPEQVQIAPTSPGIFSVNFGVGQAIAINLDGSLAAPVGSIPGLATHPAKRGDYVIILATGLGAVDPPISSGSNSLDQIRRTVETPTVLFGGVPSTPDFSGLSGEFVGVNQLNVIVPPGAPAGDTVSLQIQMDGLTTTDQVTLAVGP